MLTTLVALGIIATAGICSILLTKWILSLRRVVPTNQVHIVQRAKSTTSYGKDTEDNAGNTYYEWPSWIPVIGVTKIVLPVSVFDLDLVNYEAYDKGRLPFVVDIKAFFRIENSNTAASRVESFEELHSQLKGIVQGSVRTIMANSELESIMSERSTYGEQFTKEVEEQLKAWGVTAVKNIELMDIRDAQGGFVIQNIMAKKQSLIEMESRTEVAANLQKATQAEIDAKREVDLRNEQARQSVGLRKAEVDKDVGIANEQSTQAVKEQQRVTMEKQMAIQQVSLVRASEIEKEQQIVAAQQEKETSILIAEGQLEAKKREAEGVRVEGGARAEAEKLMQLAPVQAQIALAKEIGGNDGYQKYLVTIEQVKAAQTVGVEQAKALTKADIKVIANSGDIPSGMNNVMDLFTTKGGTNLGGALEALSNTPIGKSLLDKLTAPQEANA